MSAISLVFFIITADKHQPWTNYENNRNEYLIIVCSEYSNS